MLEVLIGLDEVRRWSDRITEPDEEGVPEPGSGPGEPEPTARGARSVSEARSPRTPWSRARLLRRVLARQS
jgi:hypothetical protein